MMKKEEFIIYNKLSSITRYLILVYFLLSCYRCINNNNSNNNNGFMIDDRIIINVAYATTIVNMNRCSSTSRNGAFVARHHCNYHHCHYLFSSSSLSSSVFETTTVTRSLSQFRSKSRMCFIKSMNANTNTNTNPNTNTNTNTNINYHNQQKLQPLSSSTSTSPSSLQKTNSYSNTNNNNNNNNLLEYLKSQVSLSKIISECTTNNVQGSNNYNNNKNHHHITLKPMSGGYNNNGEKFMSLCPFHDEKTPSFGISDDIGLYHCFGCGAKGDAIKFLMEYEKLTFKEALYRIADIGDIDLSQLPQSLNLYSFAKDMNQLSHQNMKMKKLQSILLMASEYYHNCLIRFPGGGMARSHLRERNISPNLATKFGLGYSPTKYQQKSISFGGNGITSGRGSDSSSSSRSSRSRSKHMTGNGNSNSLLTSISSSSLIRDTLVNYLLQIPGNNFTMNDLGEAGLISKKNLMNNNNYNKNDIITDLFHSRLIIPIKNQYGNIIAFGGRDLNMNKQQQQVLQSSSASSSSSESTTITTTTTNNYYWPKYLNSPETFLFKKRENLYGLWEAKSDIKNKKFAIIVEGYFDVIALHSIGIQNTVGCLGTAISIEQIKLLSKHLDLHVGRRIILNLDNDDAGVKAMERFCTDVMLHLDNDVNTTPIDIKIARLPDGIKDAASFVEIEMSNNNNNNNNNNNETTTEMNTVVTPIMIAEKYNKLVLEKAISWAEWYCERMLQKFDKSSSSGFSLAIDSLTDFISQLKRPTDRTFLTFKFAEVLAMGNTAMKATLETDLTNTILSKINNRENKGGYYSNNKLYQQQVSSYGLKKQIGIHKSNNYDSGNPYTTVNNNSNNRFTVQNKNILSTKDKKRRERDQAEKFILTYMLSNKDSFSASINYLQNSFINKGLQFSTKSRDWLFQQILSLLKENTDHKMNERIILDKIRQNVPKEFQSSEVKNILISLKRSCASCLSSSQIKAKYSSEKLLLEAVNYISEGQNKIRSM